MDETLDVFLNNPINKSVTDGVLINVLFMIDQFTANVDDLYCNLDMKPENIGISKNKPENSRSSSSSSSSSLSSYTTLFINLPHYYKLTRRSDSD